MAIKPSARYALSYQDQALWERGDLSIEGVRAALTRRDPRLAEYIVKLTQLDPAMDEEEANKHKNRDLDKSKHKDRDLNGGRVRLTVCK